MELRNYELKIKIAELSKIIQADLGQRNDLGQLPENASFDLYGQTLQLRMRYQFGFGTIDAPCDSVEEAKTAVDLIMVEFRKRKREWEETGKRTEEMARAIRAKNQEIVRYPFSVAAVMHKNNINGVEQSPVYAGVKLMVDYDSGSDLAAMLYGRCLSISSVRHYDHRRRNSFNNGASIVFGDYDDASEIIGWLKGMCGSVECPTCAGNYLCDHCDGDGCRDCDGEPWCPACKKGEVFGWVTTSGEAVA